MSISCRGGSQLTTQWSGRIKSSRCVSVISVAAHFSRYAASPRSGCDHDFVG
ncbi:hypothetical protein QUB80_28195 [Chlorogloeopsis sp. ULAP01]|uniref:hypothetical protein n=1 Tax=Chlorogloeopsis sp. ULAP01 TaxID=3056483 RepID=UPI0025AB2B8C|nr:hypothetical protein [Chlorogloeopsis sp. ULAP01]MDM9384553.1 hypothetical protein [Chlorogloeopsis sp. ULAP01]